MKDLKLKNIVELNGRSYLVSTIATPVRHTWFDGDGKRVVFETMVFEMVDEDIDFDRPLFNERYHSAEEAILEHSTIIKSLDKFIKL